MPSSVVPRVLLVEDDPGDVFLVRELLAEVDTRIELSVATSVAEAVDSGELATADCVLLDLGLPDLPGRDRLDALRLLRGRAPQLCAICVLTGLDDEHLGAAAMAEGAQDYLVKGTVDGQLLARAVRYSVERRRAERNAVRLRGAQLERAESARVERGLLPRLLLDDSFVTAQTFYRPGRRSALGGDFYDAIRCPDGSVHALVGDVSGHGPDEAALGALLRVSWRALVLSGVGEPEVLPALQLVLNSERQDPWQFTTAITLAVRDSDSTSGGAHLGVRVAGHPGPVRLRPGLGELPFETGPPLGVLADAKWPLTTSSLPSGWAVMLYSDGLIEGWNGPARAERLWTNGLLDLLAGHRETRLPDLPARLVEQVIALNGGPLSDDLALLLLCDQLCDEPAGGTGGAARS